MTFCYFPGIEQIKRFVISHVILTRDFYQLRVQF